MVTIKDVAARAGVSVATVSYVINGTKVVAPETAARVRKAIEELDYQPNAVAQSLRKRSTRVLGMVVSDIGNPFFATLVKGAEDCARTYGYNLIITNTSENPENEKTCLNLLFRRRVDGIIIAPTGHNEALVRRFIRQGMHVVFVDRVLPGLEVPAVLSENEKGAYNATSHLLDHGHRRIGIILGLPQVSTTWERLEGYKRALADYGVELDKNLIVFGDSRIAGGKEACQKLISHSLDLTAIFITNNLMTIGAMQGLRELSLSCPSDISVVGFDDFEWTEAFYPPLTVVAQRPYDIGWQAVEILLNLHKGEEPSENPVIRLETELKVRGSVTNPRNR